MFKKIFGTANSRYIKSLSPIISAVNNLEKSMESLADEELVKKTFAFKNRLADKDQKTQAEILEEILPEAFATVREGAKRTLKQRHYDVQLMGGIILHRGMIAEMKTGEGKTLVSTLPAYLNALTGNGVHIVTVNDYLAERDSKWMGKIFEFLGLTVGCITNKSTAEERHLSYISDVTYATNNELGFDALRDNMRMDNSEKVQRGYHYAIIDEVDSILIDEARTPLIISGPVQQDIGLYRQMSKIIPQLEEIHYKHEEEDKDINLTDEGVEYAEKLLKESGIIAPESHLYSIENSQIVQGLSQALKAHKIFKKDVDYLLQDGKVMIIDEFTGRIMEGRRYSEGLHQSLEAKEGVKIQQENQTLASITFQNYFRLYPKLSGMTGTALTEASEFKDIYGLKAIELPTNIPIKRIDDDDDIYRTTEEKYQAIVDFIKQANAKGQPVLAGTISIEKSEHLSRLLKKAKVKHMVLNAKYHKEEASIIAQAGHLGAVTIATNMAGRGTDIKLGGNEEMLYSQAIANGKKPTETLRSEIEQQVQQERQKVKQAGGLAVIGTERHESRRIDNQLRGRSGRQGDEGYSKFFLSAEDDLFRIFGISGGIGKAMGVFNSSLKNGSLNSPLLTRFMEKAQLKVEGKNYEIRKNLLKFDDVMNEQRSIIYEERNHIMSSDGVDEDVLSIIQESAEAFLSKYLDGESYQIDKNIITTEAEKSFNINIKELLPILDEDEEKFRSQFLALLLDDFHHKHKLYGELIMQDIKKKLMLITIDQLWREHLHAMDYLKQGISLRAYGQKDPLTEYKREAFNMFNAMLLAFKQKFCLRIMHFKIEDEQSITLIQERLKTQQTQGFNTNMQPVGSSEQSLTTHHTTRHTTQGRTTGEKQKQVTIRNRNATDINPQDPSTWGRVRRNDPCPCGSGKKYKYCHGASG